jgi:hypothetical protein
MSWRTADVVDVCGVLGRRYWIYLSLLIGVGCRPSPELRACEPRPEPVVLDLVQPQRAGRRPWRFGREARGDEAGWNGTRPHSGALNRPGSRKWKGPGEADLRALRPPFGGADWHPRGSRYINQAFSGKFPTNNAHFVTSCRRRERPCDAVAFVPARAASPPADDVASRTMGHECPAASVAERA